MAGKDTAPEGRGFVANTNPRVTPEVQAIIDQQKAMKLQHLPTSEEVFASWPDWHGREIEIIKGTPPALVVFDVQSKSMRKHYLDDDEIKHIVGGLIHNIPLEWWGEQGGSQ